MKIIKIINEHIAWHFYVATFWWLLFSFLSQIWRWEFLVLVLIGAFIIDLDHLLAAFFYDRQQPNNLVLRQYVKKWQWIQAMEYGLNTHKSNTFFLTHNIYFVLFLEIMLFFSQGNGGGYLFSWAL